MLLRVLGLCNGCASVKAWAWSEGRCCDRAHADVTHRCGLERRVAVLDARFRDLVRARTHLRRLVATYCYVLDDQTAFEPTFCAQTFGLGLVDADIRRVSTAVRDLVHAQAQAAWIARRRKYERRVLVSNARVGLLRQRRPWRGDFAW
jgi:hypothetical protein